MNPKINCNHTSKRCSLNRTDEDYVREDICTACNEHLVCEHFKVQKQVIRYGRDRYKPAAVVNAVEEFITDEFIEFDIGEY